MYVCMYVCLYVGMYVYMYVCMSVCIYVCTYRWSSPQRACRHIVKIPQGRMILYGCYLSRIFHRPINNDVGLIFFLLSPFVKNAHTHGDRRLLTKYVSYSISSI